MTEADATRIVGFLSGSYLRVRLDRGNLEALTSGILDLDAAETMLGARRLVKTSQYFPSVAELREASRAVGVTARLARAETRGLSEGPVPPVPESVLAWMRKRGYTIGRGVAP